MTSSQLTFLLVQSSHLHRCFPFPNETRDRGNRLFFFFFSEQMVFKLLLVAKEMVAGPAAVPSIPRPKSIAQLTKAHCFQRIPRPRNDQNS